MVVVATLFVCPRRRPPDGSGSHHHRHNDRGGGGGECPPAGDHQQRHRHWPGGMEGGVGVRDKGKRQRTAVTRASMGTNTRTLTRRGATAGTVGAALGRGSAGSGVASGCTLKAAVRAVPAGGGRLVWPPRAVSPTHRRTHGGCPPHLARGAPHTGAGRPPYGSESLPPWHGSHPHGGGKGWGNAGQEQPTG